MLHLLNNSLAHGLMLVGCSVDVRNYIRVSLSQIQASLWKPLETGQVQAFSIWLSIIKYVCPDYVVMPVELNAPYSVRLTQLWSIYRTTGMRQRFLSLNSWLWHFRRVTGIHWPNLLLTFRLAKPQYVVLIIVHVAHLKKTLVRIATKFSQCSFLRFLRVPWL